MKKLADRSKNKYTYFCDRCNQEKSRGSGKPKI